MFKKAPLLVEQGHNLLQSLTIVEVLALLCFGARTLFWQVLISTHYFILHHVIDFSHLGNSALYCPPLTVKG